MSPAARFKDLCVDANDAGAVGRFWADVLGLEYVEHADGDAQLDGPSPQHRIWVNQVPEPRTVKNRVHFDVASAVDRPDTDPEGGEFSVSRHVELDYRLVDVVVDATDPERVARWWASAFGTELHREREDWWWLHPPGAPFNSMFFQHVPEPKAAKNRIHWDVDTDVVQSLVDLGATVLRPPGDGTPWTVLADPEGNEFCAFVHGVHHS